ncbi:mitochondrial ribosomal protein L27-domain-containing protein [Pseudomassariella vexata]|uniref:Mitochondrial ribosomal protein L27-domain-containing protein n=1 Tax=Pseudomassariella vexata TaxID=1141098 RepID=A0A1Y2DPZ1_9PEZI|nr:mitochondrial ribosomal protein L27-domain-containing protein [Pseudomassariella vexata]ORY61320.1 mitochondrial ribosomal protein L27-domain-containing protein [Pseudomassariella vexata]
MQPTTVLRAAYRKLPLTTKDIKKGFYKGTRTGSMGSHTKFGGYIIDWNKVRTYVVPEGLNEFKLTPFVTQRMPRTRGTYDGPAGGPKSPELYLERWKSENGLD